MKPEQYILGHELLERWGINEATLKAYVKDHGLTPYDANLNPVRLGPRGAFAWEEEKRSEYSFRGEQRVREIVTHTIRILEKNFKVSEVEQFEQEHEIERRDLRERARDRKQCIALANSIKTRSPSLTLRQLAEICKETEYGRPYDILTIEKKWLTGKVKGGSPGRPKKTL
jgi:hypothetical protein